MSPRLRFVVLVLLTAVVFFQAFPQDEIRKRQDELQAIRDQIRDLESKIGEQQKNERETLELIDSYEKKATLLRRLITSLRNDEGTLTRRIENTRKGMEKLENQLSFLKKHYASYVVSIYKRGRERDIELLLSSHSINQVYIRNQYLKRFTNQRRRDAQGIAAKRKQVEDTQAQLHIQLSEEQRLLAEKGAEDERVVSAVADADIRHGAGLFHLKKVPRSARWESLKIRDTRR